MGNVYNYGSDETGTCNVYPLITNGQQIYKSDGRPIYRDVGLVWGMLEAMHLIATYYLR